LYSVTLKCLQDEQQPYRCANNLKIYWNRRNTVLDKKTRHYINFGIKTSHWFLISYSKLISYFRYFPSVQHYVIKCVSDLRQVGVFLRVLRFREILLKMPLNSIKPNIKPNQMTYFRFSNCTDKLNHFPIKSFLMDFMLLPKKERMYSCIF
jgi:hypothetical protein